MRPFDFGQTGPSVLDWLTRCMREIERRSREATRLEEIAGRDASKITYAGSGGRSPGTIESALARPFFRARLSADQTVPNNVDTEILFTTEDFDEGALYDAPNRRWTPPKGPVLLTAAFAVSGVAGPTRLGIYRNGSLVKEALSGDSRGGSINIIDVASGTDTYTVKVMIGNPAPVMLAALPSDTWFAGAAL